MRFKCNVSSVKLFVLATTLCLSFIVAPLLTVEFVSAQTPTPSPIDPNQYTPQPSNEGPSQTPVATNGDIVANVNIIISADGKAGTYGPLKLEIYDSNGTGIDTANTTTATSDSKSKIATPLAVTAAFSGIKIGKYKICLSGSKTLCTPIFDRAANGDMTAPTITIPASESDKFFTTTPAGSGAPTCGSEVSAVGWLVCPIINGLTAMNDAMWGIVSSLLTVNPLNQKDASGVSTVYTAWGSIRSIANVLFAIFFLVIIFSQLTSFGIDNYGIKKLLPRLIICAILVNISFVIVQIMVDLANILGSSLYNLLISITGEVNLGWGSLVNLITGSLTGVGLAVGGVALAGGAAAAFWMLLPMAAMAALGLLTAVLTLIFRQAVIPVLAILAPLAFVAYLLPNTEQWFKKWRDMMISMLMLYPMAALVFGGAQFAAKLIIDDGTDWWKLLIGLIILAVPLFSLPFLARQGGSILSAVGGAMGKLAEKARSPLTNYGKSRADEARAEYRADTGEHGNIRKLAERTRFGKALYNSPRNFNRATETRRADREKDTNTAKEVFKSQGVNNQVKGVFGRTVDGKSAVDRATDAGAQTNIDNNAAKARFEDRERTGLALRGKASEAALKAAEDKSRKLATEASSHSDAPHLRALDPTVRASLQESRRTSDTMASGTLSAEREVKQEYSDAVAKSYVIGGHSGPSEYFDPSGAPLLDRNGNDITYFDRQNNEIADAAEEIPITATAIEAASIDPRGVQHVQATETSNQSRAKGDNVTAAGTIFAAQNYTSSENGDYMKIVENGIRRDGLAANPEEQEAAMDALVRTGSVKSMAKIQNHLSAMAKSGDPSAAKLQQAYNSMLISSSKKPKSSGGAVLGSLAAGNLTDTFEEGLVKYAQAGKFAPSEFASMDKDEIGMMADTLGSVLLANPMTVGTTQIADLHMAISGALNDPLYKGSIPPEKRDKLMVLLSAIDPTNYM